MKIVDFLEKVMDSIPNFLNLGKKYKTYLNYKFLGFAIWRMERHKAKTFKKNLYTQKPLNFNKIEKKI